MVPSPLHPLAVQRETVEPIDPTDHVDHVALVDVSIYIAVGRKRPDMGSLDFVRDKKDM
jgi:hypothetical protein